MRFHLPLPLCRQQRGREAVPVVAAEPEAVAEAEEQGLRLPKAEHPRRGLLLQAPVLLLALVLQVPEVVAVEAEAVAEVEEAVALLHLPHPHHLYNLWTFV